MNLLIVILIIIIILSIIYLLYRNKQYNYSLESFNNNTQSSLSTYFQNTVDYDSYKTNTNAYHGNQSIQSIYHKNQLTQTIKKNVWDGLWENKELHIYVQFIQNNDRIIIAIGNSSFEQMNNKVKSTNIKSSIGSVKCYNNSFVGIGNLNNNFDKFILKEVLCSNYSNPDLNLTINNFTGKIVDNIIQLHSMGKGQVIPLTLKNKVPTYNNYSKKIAPNTNTYPIINNSTFNNKENPCVNSKPCMDKSNGLSLTLYNNIQYNACGNPKSVKDNTCDDKPTCVFYSQESNGSDGSDVIEKCNFKTAIFDYMNLLPLTIQTQYEKNSLLLCNHLEYFRPGKYNTCIICYVTDIGNVYTLNYEFFGTLHGESNLTVQCDIMDHKLNKPLLESGLLPFYRNAIKNNTNRTDLMNGLSFTNCEGSTCIDKPISFINNYNGPIGNILLNPCVWNINNIKTENVLNSCPIILSTFSKYNTPIKYAEFNEDGTTSLSLFSGGLKQHLMFDKLTILNNDKEELNKYVIMTTNIKTNNGSYLIPSTDNNGFFNSKVIRLVDKPLINGKWIIIGFRLFNLNTLTRIINNISF
jgi:hypothetical protein